MARYAISPEGAASLTELANNLLISANNIIESSASLESKIAGFNDGLGIYGDEILSLVERNKQLLHQNREAIVDLAVRVKAQADEIMPLYQAVSPIQEISEIKEHAEYRPIDYVQMNSTGGIDHLVYNQPVLVDSDTIKAISNNTLSFHRQDEARDWASQNFQSWRRSLTTEQVASIMAYSGSQYGVINKQSRLITRSTEDIETISQDIDDALSQAVLPCDMLLYRGLSEDALLDMARHAGGPLQSGTELNEQAFLSASMTPDTQFCDGQTSIMRLTAVKGLHGAPLLHGDLAINDHESEILFPRNHGIYIQNVVRCPRSVIVPGAGDDIITVIDGILTIF